MISCSAHWSPGVAKSGRSIEMGLERKKEGVSETWWEQGGVHANEMEGEWTKLNLKMKDTKDKI